MSVDASEAPSAGFFSAQRAIALALAAGSLVLIGGWFFGWDRFRPDPKQPPACYWADEANYTPLNDPIPLRGAPGRDGPSIDQRRDQTSLERLTEAENACRVDACSREALAKYRSAVFWYLSPRLQHTRQLDRAHGGLGLRRAAEIYDEPLDARIEKGLRDRYRAGVFRINDFRQNRDAIAIFILKGGAALRPCRKADVSRARS